MRSSSFLSAWVCLFALTNVACSRPADDSSYLSKPPSHHGANSGDRAAVDALRFRPLYESITDLPQHLDSAGLVIALPFNHFAPNQTDFSREAAEKLSPLVRFLKARPQEVSYLVPYGGTSVTLNPTMDIEEQRAHSLRNYLIEKGVNADKIIVQGKGSFQVPGSAQKITPDGGAVLIFLK